MKTQMVLKTPQRVEVKIQGCGWKCQDNPMADSEKKGDSLDSPRKHTCFKVAACETSYMLAQMAIRVCIQSGQILAKVEEG